MTHLEGVCVCVCVGGCSISVNALAKQSDLSCKYSIFELISERETERGISASLQINNKTQ